MGEAAQTLPQNQGQGVNPNIEVGDEKVTTVGGASSVDFDTFDRLHDQETQEQQTAKLKAKKPKAAPPPKDDGDDLETDDEPKEAAKGKGEAGDGKGKDAAKAKDGEPSKTKAKVHKVKVGDQVMDLAGDAVFTVPVNGKKEDVSLQDLVNDYNGRTEWHRRLSEVDQRDKHVAARDESIKKMIGNLLERSKEDPSAAFDFLAEMSKQDPVKIKEQVLRQQIAAILPLAQMDESEREVYIKDQVRNWRDNLHAQREKAIENDKKAQAEAAERQKTMSTYGIDEQRWKDCEEKVRAHLKLGAGEKVPKDLIVQADKLMIADDVVQEVVPNLAKHERFGDILEDIAMELIRHPELTRENLAKQLVAAFGEDDKALRKVSQRAAKTALVSHSEPPAERRPTQAKEPMFFDDL